MKPPVLILHAPGTNRDREAAWAIETAGGAPTIVRIQALLQGGARLMDHRMLVLPGGFSFGDDLGAGKLWASALTAGLGDQLLEFVASGRPVLGICNGFQALVRAGLLPGDGAPFEQRATLTRNREGRFECRWVRLRPEAKSPCVFTQGLTEDILCPVAHGEGRLASPDDAQRARNDGLAALRYVSATGGAPSYPENPNGSEGDIAGLTNPAGNVLGLMPHPEDHILPRQHPRAHRGERSGSGLPLFERGVQHAANL